MIPINIPGDGVCTSRDGLPNQEETCTPGAPEALITIGTPTENIKVALDLLTTFRTPSYL